MSMRSLVLAALALVLLMGAAALAAPVTVSVTFAGAPEKLDGLTAYFYSSSGLAGTAGISGNATSISLEPGVYYMKVTGSKIAALLLINTTQATSYTFSFSQGFIGVNATVKGFPGSVDYRVELGGMNATTSTRYALYTVNAPSIKVFFPEQLLFPAIFGYRLKAVTVDGVNATNGFTLSTAGMHQVTAEYELSTPNLWLVAAAVVLVIVIAVLLARRRATGVRAAAQLLQSEWVE
jgi:opacity protein-like surface antigen